VPPLAVNVTTSQAVVVPLMVAVAVLMVTALDEVAVQLLASVTVTVYVPEVANALDAEVVLAPPFHS
jgi:hypothetical protein